MALTDDAVVGGSDLTFSGTFTDAMEAERIVAYASAVLGAKSIGLLFADDPAHEALANRIVRAARKIRLGVAQTEQWGGSGPGNSFLTDAFPAIKATAGASRLSRRMRMRLFGQRDTANIEEQLGFQAFVVVGDATAASEIVRQLRQAEVELPVIGTTELNDAAFIEKAGDLARGVFVPAGHTWEIETQDTKVWHGQFDEDVEPSDEVLYTVEALQLVVAAAKEGATNADGVASFLAARQDPDTAVAGLSGLLYFDESGVMQREPWFLTMHRGRLKPAFTQLRKVVDPRELWRAEQEQKEAEDTAPEPLTRAERREARRGPVETAEVLPRRIVKVGKQAYHQTAVVYAGIDFFRVNDVSVGEQAFDVELYLWFMWQGDVDIENIGFINQIYTEEGTWEVLRSDLEGEIKYVCYKIKGRFLTPYDLREFPFDAQRLPLTLAHNTRDANDLMLVVDKDALSHDPITTIYPEEWRYQNRADFSSTYDPPTTFGDPAYLGLASRSSFSTYQTEIVVKRILFPYLVTMFLPLAIMVLIALFVVFVPPSQFDARLTLVMTALLSVVVFHLAQGESLPNVGYLMRADQYFMVTYLLLFVLVIKTVLVNLAVSRVSERALMGFEMLFAAGFIPMTILLYVGLTFGSPFGGGSDEVPVEAAVTETVEEAPADVEATEGEAIPETEARAVPPADADPNSTYVDCAGTVRPLDEIIQPILTKMEATEIPYTQDQRGGDQLRDCSGNFLRVSSWVATECPNLEPVLAASAGVTDFKKGGNNVFKGELKKWTNTSPDGKETPAAARSSRGTAGWYHKQGTFIPVFADSKSQPIDEPSADLKRIRNMIRPGTVVWYLKSGPRITKKDGVEAMIKEVGGRITHLGVVHSVTRDENGDVVSYKLYHGRRAYNSSDPEKQDNKITEHEWAPTSRSTKLPPFGNWTDPVGGIAPIVPAVAI